MIPAAPPPRPPSLLHQCLRWGSHCLGCFFFWTLWLLLALLLGFQIYTATIKQMPVPAFLLRSLEQQLARSEISAQLGKASFDPTGQIVIQDLRLSLPGFAEPVAQAHSIYIQLDPWALLTRRFEVDTLRASGLSLYIPAMLSSSGAREPLWENAELKLDVHAHDLELVELSAQATQLNKLAIGIRGRLDLRAFARGESQAAGAPPAAELFARYYPLLCRRLSELAPWAAGLHSGARLSIALSADETAGALAQITLSGNGYTAPERAGTGFSLAGFRAVSTPLPLKINEDGAPLEIALELDSLELALPELPAQLAARLRNADPLRRAQLRGLRSHLGARLEAGEPRAWPRTLELQATALDIAGVPLRDIALRAELHGWPQLQVSAVLQVDEAPLALDAQLDLAAASAQVHANGRAPRATLSYISQYIKADLTRFVRFEQSPEFELDLGAVPGQPLALSGRFAARELWARGVTFDKIGGQIAIAGTHFVGTQAYAVIGSNYARGSYTQDLRTQDFRFLLNGQLRPPDISPWFQNWWRDFWQKFDFAQAAPEASVDVQGRWGPAAVARQHAQVFVYADSERPAINGTALDRVRTRLYIKPNNFHALELAIRQDGRRAQGWFLRRNDPATKQLARQDFDFGSTLALPTIGTLLGPELQSALAPLDFAGPVAVQARGFTAAAGARHIALQGSTNEDFRLYDFPLNGLNFRATLDDGTLRIDSLSAGLAEGLVSGRVHLQGLGGGAPMLGFDLSLAQGKFYQWAGIVSDYLARRRGEEPPPNVEKNTNVTIDLDVSAEGSTSDTLSFIGSGNMELKGRGLGEIHIFGLLSELLSFTSLHFNQLLTSFSIEKDKIVFPEVSITGSNSAISASGHYSLGLGQLDFRARVNPFQESSFILKSLAGLMLTPISSALEVHLTGPLNKPKWSFLHLGAAPKKVDASATGAAAEDETAKDTKGDDAQTTTEATTSDDGAKAPPEDAAEPTAETATEAEAAAEKEWDAKSAKPEAPPPSLG